MARLIEVLNLLPSLRGLVRLLVHRCMMIETQHPYKRGSADGDEVEPAGPHCLAAADVASAFRSRSLAAAAKQWHTHDRPVLSRGTHARKTTDREAEFAGLCILISDQTLTPYHVRIRAALETDEIEWLDCRLGEIRDDQMVRIPYSSNRGKWAVVDRLNTIQWRYHVGFGTPNEVAR